MSLPFKAGDRIRYHNQTGPSADGVVVQDSGMGPCQVLVKLDSAAYTSWAYSGYLEKLAPLENSASWTFYGAPSYAEAKASMASAARSQEMNAFANRVVDRISEKFRRESSMRKWETSYTKRVVETLVWMRNFQEKNLPYHQNLTAAIDLLTGYWNDLHIPYEQRDAARGVSKVFKKAAEENAKEIERLHGVATGFRHELSELDSALADYENRLIELKADLAKAKAARAEAMLENVNLREIIANAQRALEHKP